MWGNTLPKNPFLRFCVLMAHRYNKHNVAIQSAALAFYLLFTIFPFLIFISALLGLLNLNTAIRDFKFLKDHGQLEPYEGKKTFKQLFYDNLDWVSGVLMLVYVFSIGSLGFLLPSIVYMFLQILLYTTMGKRNYLVAILSSVLIPCAVYFLFRNYFFLMLPKGILG